MSEIIRTVKSENYTHISNIPAKDTSLSWKAKGLLYYLLTRPNNWTVCSYDLEKQSKDGRDSVRAGLNELERSGYLVRRLKRDNAGRVIGRESCLYEHPRKQANDPETGFPSSANPISGNPLLLKTDPQQLLTSMKTDNNNSLSAAPQIVSLHLSEETQGAKAQPRKNHTSPAMIEQICKAYPKQVKAIPAKKSIVAAIKRLHEEAPTAAGGESWDRWLLERVQAYAAARKALTDDEPAQKPFTPDPATWFNRGQYHDDPAEWATKPRESSADRSKRVMDEWEQEASRRHRKPTAAQRGEYPEDLPVVLWKRRKPTAAERGEYPEDDLPVVVLE